MKHLNMKQALSEFSSRSFTPYMLLHIMHRTCPLQHAFLQAVKLSSSLGMVLCKTGGRGGVSWGPEPSSTYMQTTPMTFPTRSLRRRWQSWPRSAASGLWKRGELHSGCPCVSVFRDIFCIRSLFCCLWPLMKTWIHGKILHMSGKVAPSISHYLFNSFYQCPWYGCQTS